VFCLEGVNGYQFLLKSNINGNVDSKLPDSCANTESLCSAYYYTLKSVQMAIICLLAKT
jgi:hypothetical protein